MENSVTLIPEEKPAPAPEKVEKAAPVSKKTTSKKAKADAKKPAGKKSAPKKGEDAAPAAPKKRGRPPKKKVEGDIPAAPEVAKRVAGRPKKTKKKSTFGIGDELPIYLL